MKLNPQDLEKITDLTLKHYNEHAEDFWEGSRPGSLNRVAVTLTFVQRLRLNEL